MNYLAESEASEIQVEFVDMATLEKVLAMVKQQR